MEKPKESSTPLYVFDDVVLDRDNYRLRKRDQISALTPRAYDVLIYLLERRGRVVSKQELFEQVWKESFVTDNALVRSVKEIRQALVDNATAPRYIETVHKRGYRFIAEVKVVSGVGELSPAILDSGLTPFSEVAPAQPIIGPLHPAVALACLASVLTGLVLIALLSGQVTIHRLVGLDKSSEALQERARDFLQKQGYGDHPIDSDYGFIIDDDYLKHLSDQDQSATRWNQLAASSPTALPFWYRQSPRYLETSAGLVSLTDPPFENPGMANLMFDPQGRLIAFAAIPTSPRQSTNDPAGPNWPALFTEAGLDFARFTPVNSQRAPPFASDFRAAWEGTYPDHPEIPLHLEVAAYRGRLVYFEIEPPWGKPFDLKSSQTGTHSSALNKLLIALFVVGALAGIWLVRRNLRLHRGDRKGAFRLALFAFSLTLFGQVASSHHVPTVIGEFELWKTLLPWALLTAGVLWLLYTAMEPFVFRRWPLRIFSWTHLLDGNFRDPIIGRDLLIGVTSGVFRLLLAEFRFPIWKWLGWPPMNPIGPMGIWLETLRGPAGAIRQLVGTLGWMVISGLAVFFLLVLLSILLRRDWLAILVFWIVFSIGQYLAFSGPTINSFDGTMNLFYSSLEAAAFIIVLTRFGLLAGVTGQIFFLLLKYFPITSDLSAWYAGRSTFLLLTTAAVAIYGFYTSFGGEPIIRERLQQD